MRWRPEWKRLLAALLVAAALWFLGRMVVQNWDELRAHEWQVATPLLVLSVVAHVAVLGWGVWVWNRVLAHFAGDRPAMPVLLRMWFVSNLARYVPGKVWQFLAVAQLARAEGLSATHMLSSVLVHTGLALLSALVVGAMTIGHALVPGVPWWATAAAATAVAATLVHPAVLNAGLGLIPRLLQRPVIAWTGGWLDGLVLLALSVLSWVFYGGAYYLLVASLTPTPVDALPLLTGVNAWSFLAGYLAFFSVAGLGAREIAMAALLLPLLPPGVAALLAVAARLWTVAAELIGGALALWIARRGAAVAGPRERINPNP